MMTTKALRNKRMGIRTVKKMTQAMQAIASSKMRRTQERMRGSRAYAEMIKRIVQNLTQSELTYRHPYLVGDPHATMKRAGYLVISSRRGLCGGLNMQLFKAVMVHQCMRADQQEKPVFGLLGIKAVHYFGQLGANIIAQKTGLSDMPTLKDVIGPIHSLLNLFKNREIQKIYLCYNQFVSASKLVPRVELLVPFDQGIVADAPTHGENPSGWNYIYEPNPKELLDQLLPRAIESLVYQAVLENLACEQAARTLAMQMATENAEQSLIQLELAHHKLRQAIVTRELAEIVSGSLSLEGMNGPL